ncbi:MAG: hypothetical protein ACOX4V_03075 [Anaerovoracaceae bacterium]|jgi:hypothetical protein
MISTFYPMDDNIKAIQENEIKKLSKIILNVPFKEGNFTHTDLFFGKLINELKIYLEREITVATTYYIALVQSTSISYEVMNYNAENAIFRISSFWEHLFQILNPYLEINLAPKKYFVQEQDESWSLTNNKVTSKKSEIKKLKLNKKYLERNNFLKAVKKKFDADYLLREIINGANSNNQKRIREIRNEIIHQHFLSQSTVINHLSKNSKLFTINNSRIKHNELSNILEEGLKEQYIALEKTLKLIREDLAPSRKESNQKQFKFSKITCKCSPNQELIIPYEMIEKDKQSSNPQFKFSFCPNCLSDDIKIENVVIDTSQQKWEEIMSHYLFELHPKYFQNKINELDSISKR